MNNLKIDELKAYVVDVDWNIIGITENWLNEGISNTEVVIANFSMYRKDRREVNGGRAGGVIVYVKESIISFRVRNLINIALSLSGVR